MNKTEDRQKPKIDRWFLKCRSCKKPWTVDLDKWEGDGRGASRSDLLDEAEKSCPHCDINGDDEHFNHKIMGKVRFAHPNQIEYLKKLKESGIAHVSECDARCTNAKGPACGCICGGWNHGTS